LSEVRKKDRCSVPCGQGPQGEVTSESGIRKREGSIRKVHCLGRIKKNCRTDKKRKRKKKKKKKNPTRGGDNLSAWVSFGSTESVCVQENGWGKGWIGTPTRKTEKVGKKSEAGQPGSRIPGCEKRKERMEQR